MHVRNPQRESYIFTQRQAGRTFTDIVQELGLSPQRIRQIYTDVCRAKRRRYFDTHPGAYWEWVNLPSKERQKFIPEE